MHIMNNHQPHLLNSIFIVWQQRWRAGACLAVCRWGIYTVASRAELHYLIRFTRSSPSTGPCQVTASSSVEAPFVYISEAKCTVTNARLGLNKMNKNKRLSRRPWMSTTMKKGRKTASLGYDTEVDQVAHERTFIRFRKTSSGSFITSYQSPILCILVCLLQLALAWYFANN